MTVFSELADFVSGVSYSTIRRETVECLKMHILDTIGVMLVGPQTAEGIEVGKLLAKLEGQGNVPVIGFSTRASLLPSIVAECAATRCAEVDDIHLQSCTTPGSVIIPAALSLASAGHFPDPKDFLVAVTVGYDLLIRLGIALGGPTALYKGIWPTCFAAALGSSTVAARALRLSGQQTKDAISTAFMMSTGLRSMGASSRGMQLGVAAQSGIIAAFSAGEGLVGDDTLLDRSSGRIYGLKISPEKLVEGLGQRFLVDETGMKPYPTARQALPAIEAFREILNTHQVDPESISAITVRVPRPFAAMINRPKLPDNRLESIVSVQYQIALAAFDPEKLLDVKRQRLPRDSKVEALIRKIRVKPSRELERHYPSVWPARVEVRTGQGRHSCEMLHPKGDARNSFTWDEVTSKFRRLAKAASGKLVTDQIAISVRNLDVSTSPDHLLDHLK
jgi:2-methylcitrate dehydratase PrpD